MFDSRPEPQRTSESAAYWEAAEQAVLLVQACDSCGHYQFYPRPFCVSCLSAELSWIQVSGRGSVYTFTICRIPSHPSMAQKVPYVIALIELDEGVRLLSNVVDVPVEEVQVGARVAVRFERISQSTVLPQFTLETVEAR